MRTKASLPPVLRPPPGTAQYRAKARFRPPPPSNGAAQRQPDAQQKRQRHRRVKYRSPRDVVAHFVGTVQREHTQRPPDLAHQGAGQVAAVNRRVEE